MKLIPRKRKEKPLFKNKKEECDFYWSVLIKAKSGFKSELSGLTEDLHSHHLRGKPNYNLRYSRLNGICCTAGEHKFGFHHEGRKQDYEDKVKLTRGEQIFDSLKLIKNTLGGDIINEIRIELLDDLAPYSQEIKEYFESKNYSNYYIKKKYKHLLKQLENRNASKTPSDEF